MRADSSKSLGMLKKACLKRKILKAPPPNHEGTINGLRVSSHLILLKRRYRGTIVTSTGSIIVPRVIRKKTSLAG